jgi:hypothetical protein
MWYSKYLGNKELEKHLHLKYFRVLKLLFRIELCGLLHLVEDKLHELHTLKGSWIVQIKNQSDFSMQ